MCKYCDLKNYYAEDYFKCKCKVRHIGNRNVDADCYMAKMDDGWYLRIYCDDSDDDAVKIYYCPFCGRKLEEEE